VTTTYQISEEEIAYDAISILEEWFRGYMTMGDGRQYKLVQVEHGETSMVVRVESTRYLDVEEDQFEVEIRVRKVDT
jgi:hypothetical protein